MNALCTTPQNTSGLFVVAKAPRKTRYQIGEVTLSIVTSEKAEASFRALNSPALPEPDIIVSRLFVCAGIASEEDMQTVVRCASLNRLNIIESAFALLNISIHLAVCVRKLAIEVVTGDMRFGQAVIAANHIHLTGASLKQSRELISS